MQNRPAVSVPGSSGNGNLDVGRRRILRLISERVDATTDLTQDFLKLFFHAEQHFAGVLVCAFASADSG